MTFPRRGALPVASGLAVVFALGACEQEPNNAIRVGRRVPAADASSDSPASGDDDGAVDETPEGGTDAQLPLPPPVPYTNPVLAIDFADPALVRAGDRKLYAFATGGLIQRARSSDLVHWETLGNAMAAKPSWASTKNAFWAPHVTEHGGTYYLYFSAERNEGTGSFCIGVATAKGADQTFVDVGAPIVCGASFVNIDPMVLDDPATGKTLLYWGSGFEPIRVQELAADRVSLAPGSSRKDLLPTSSLPYERLVEAPWVHPHGEHFYMFSSGDDCCGNANAPAHYAVMVARSKSLLGPFATLASVTGASENTILVENARWGGPGHNAVIVDDAGTEWMVYHAFEKGKSGGRTLLIDPILYVNGWPAIAGRSPSEGEQKNGPVFRP